MKRALGRMKRRWWWLCAGCQLLSLQLGVHARADTTPAPTYTASYEQLIDDAVTAYEAGRFAEARATFRRAHEQSPTARTLRTIGMCSYNLGDYTDAVWSLESSLLEKRKPLTEDQQRHVTDLISKANQRIGRFRLQLTPASIVLDVDGRPAVVLGGSELLVELGAHRVEAHAPRYQTAYSRLNVEGGDRTTLGFELAREHRSFAVTSSARDLQQGGASRPVTSGSAMRTAGFVSLGLGAASLVGFGVVGALALSEKSRLDGRCSDARCSTRYQDNIDRYDGLRTASTVTLIAGGALAALGVTLILLQPSTPREHAAFVALIGPGSIGMRGEL